MSHDPHPKAPSERLVPRSGVKIEGQKFPFPETPPYPDDMEQKYVPTQLREKAVLYEERNRLYGDNYKRFGPVMKLLFPNGVPLATEDDHNRFGIFVQIVAKVTRYAENFERGGHDDSLDDLAVYSMMLKELDRELAEKEVNKERGK